MVIDGHNCQLLITHYKLPTTMKKRGTANWRQTNLREGYTTSACGAAAAVAAVRALVGGERVTAVTIDLPGKKNVTFELARCVQDNGGWLCGVVKDAGDDPDVTHGLEIQAYVTWQDETPGIVLAGGEGVGRVTRPGLPVDVGNPAINPVPRRIITRAITTEVGDLLKTRGLHVTIIVPGGAEVAKETLNPRLGILGGISILGTSGIVKPYSNSAYRASIYIELKMAAHNGVRHAVLTTGKRSDTYAQERFPHLPEFAFVQVGDHMDYGLKQVRRLGFEQVTISAMVGKVSKLAQGRMQTHVSQGSVDFAFLAQVAMQLGAPEPIVARVREANTAHHVQIILEKAGIDGLDSLLARMAVAKSAAFVDHALPVVLLLWDLKGNLLARDAVDANFLPDK